MGTSIKDVAKHSGVSIATVSHVLNGTRHTRPQTRERVLNSIRLLGYSQNQAARNLARGTSTLLGVIISDIRNPFFPEITAAFQEQALTHNLDALVMNTNYDAQRTLNSVRRLIGMQVPGVAIFTSQIDETVVDLLSQHRVAAVYLDLGRVDTAVSNIVLDYGQGIAAALQYLWELGPPPNLVYRRSAGYAFHCAAKRCFYRLRGQAWRRDCLDCGFRFYDERRVSGLPHDT